MTHPEPSPVVYDVRALACDAVTVDVLARLQLAARRRGRYVRLRNASRELEELIGLMGLSDVLGVEPGGHPEEREEALRVEEEADPADPAA